MWGGGCSSWKAERSAQRARSGGRSLAGFGERDEDGDGGAVEREHLGEDEHEHCGEEEARLRRRAAHAHIAHDADRHARRQARQAHADARRQVRKAPAHQHIATLSSVTIQL